MLPDAEAQAHPLLGGELFKGHSNPLPKHSLPYTSRSFLLPCSRLLF